MTGPRPDIGASADADGVQALEPAQLGTYFALMEAVSLLQHSVEQQLRAEGDLSYVQFQLLARLNAARGQLTMTELADGVVYSRSGLTYQAGLLEKAGLITRGPSPDDVATPRPAPARRSHDHEGFDPAPPEMGWSKGFAIMKHPRHLP